MSVTSQQYATWAVGAGDNSNSWANLGAATGPPNGTCVQSMTAGAAGSELDLAGYNPQSAILAATGGVQPAWLSQLYVQVTFSVDNMVNYDRFDVQLRRANGSVLATSGVPLAQVLSKTSTTATVSFDARASSIAWADLAGIWVSLVVHRIDTDMLNVDAVGLSVAYTTTAAAPPAAPTPPPGAAAKLRLYDQAGTLRATLPWASLTRTVVHNDPGAIAATVPASLLAALPDAPYLRVTVNGAEAPEWYLLDDDGDDLADAAGSARPVTIGGRGTMACLSWAVIYPFDHVPGNPMPLGIGVTYPFAGATPGAIMATLIDKAHARGAIPHISYDFTADRDSAGAPWPMTYSRVYNIGQDLLKTLTDMDSDGWADFRMVGFTLQMYTPDSSPIAADRPDVILRLGQGVTSGPRKRSRTPIRSTILANGAQGTIVEESDGPALARYGRREGYEGRDGVTDYGTLDAVTQVSLARQTSESEAITLVVAPDVVATIPGGVPAPGCYVRYDQRRLDASRFEPMRVQSIAYDYGQDSPQVSIELNDLWVDNDIRTKRRIDAILNGSSANERVPQAPYVDDGVAPSPPTGLAVTSDAFTDQGRTLQAQMTASWLAPTTNANGTLLQDLAGYDVGYRLPWVNLIERVISVAPGLTMAAWSPVPPNTMCEVHVRAVDRFGNASVWSDWVDVMTGRDTTPPPVPSTPAADNYLGMFRVQWDGKAAGAVAWPADFDHIEVHVSTTNNFTPSDATLAGTMVAAGYAFVDITYGSTAYAKLISVDRTGNKSAASPQASGTVQKVVSDDVFDGAIGSSKLADLAVITAKIGDLAVNDAKIGSLSVGKLTAGILNAAVTVSGRLATALTGARVELNGTGIYAWDGNGNNTVKIDTSGNALLTGTYKSALTGRRIEMGVSGSTGNIDIYAPNGVSGVLHQISQANGVEAMQFGLYNPLESADNLSSLWNRITINSDMYAVYRARHHEFMYQNVSGGGFRIFETNSGLSSTPQRLEVNASGFTYWGASSGVFQINSAGQVTVTGSAGGRAMFYSDGSATFQTASNGSIEVGTHRFGSASSPLLLFSNPVGGSGMIHYNSDGGGTFIDAMSWDESIWIGYRGAAFTVASDAQGKTGVAGLTGGERSGLLAQVRATPVSRYRRKPARHRETGEPLYEPREEIGLVAQQAPEQIVTGGDRGLMVDLYQMASMLWAAVGELADRVDQLHPQPGEEGKKRA